MRFRLLNIVLSMVLSGCIRTFGQQSGYSIPGYSVTHFTDDNGLPQSSIKDICMDDEGYIWLATEAGLARYDGRRFRLFAKEEMGTRQSRVISMARNPITGQLCAFVEGWGEVRLKTSAKKQVFYPLNPYFSNEYASALRGKPAALYVYYRTNAFPPFDDREAVIHVSPDTFYLASPSHVIYRTYRQVLWETDAEKKPAYFFYWQGKKLYHYNRQGIFDEITPQGVKPALRIPGFKKLIWNLPEKQTYILTRQNELLLLETDSVGQLVTVPFLSGLPPDFEIEKVFHIKKEIVFIGSLQKGLLVCKKQHFKTLAPDLPGSQSIYYGLYAVGNTIITAQKTRIAPNGKVTPLIHDGYPSFNTTLANLGTDTLFFGQANHVLVYSQKQQRLLRSVPLHNEITCLYTDPQQRVWIATIDSGIYLMNHNLVPVRQSRFAHYYYVNVMTQVSANHMLLGTTEGLLSFFPASKRLLAHAGTDRYNIRHIFRSKAGHIYFGTYGDGIFMLGKHGLQQLPTDRAEFLKTAHCILQDPKGRLWISTNKGLFVVPESELVRYARHEISRVYYHYLDKENGYSSNEFNGGCQPCGIHLESGRMAFPSMNGVVVFHPDSVYFYNPVKKLSIERVSVDDVFITETPDTVTVPRNFRQLECYLTTPFYGSPRNLLVEYTTDSTRDDSWAPVHSDRRVSFTSLPSGYSYIRFRQKKLAGLGAYNYCTLTLFKPKAFWEFPVFWTICFLALALVIMFTVRLRTRTLKQRNRKLSEAIGEARKELLVTIDSLTETTQKLEKKTRFQQWLASSIIHDLRGPLRFINFYADDIQRESDDTSLAQNRFLKSVYFSALKIYNYSDNLVQLLHIEQTSNFPPERTDFFELVEEKKDQFREQAKWNHVALVADLDSDPFIYVNKAAFSIILQNLLDNSIKNFRDGTVHISLRNTEQHSVVEIRDEGPGLPPDLLHKFNHNEYDDTSRQDGSGLGLWLVKSLMQETGGNIHFKNLPVKGLQVTLTWQIPTNGNGAWNVENG